MKVAEAIASIIALDYGAVQASQRARSLAEIEETRRYEEVNKAAHRATTALFRDFRRRLAPHAADLTAHSAISVAWDSTPPRVSGHLHGRAYPSNGTGKHRMRARFHPEFSMTFATEAEYLAQVAALKAMLQAAVDQGY